jgi:hypothetical protein
MIDEIQASGGAIMMESAAVSAYCAISSAFILVTLLEGWAARGGWTLLRVAGLAAGPVWPLLLCVFLLHGLLAPRRKPLLARSR